MPKARLRTTMSVTTALALALGGLALAPHPALAEGVSATTAKVKSLRGLVAEDLRIAAMDASTADGLRRRLDETQARLAAGTQRAADGTLAAFVDHVKARRGKTLQAGAADVLAAVARGVAPPPLTVDPAAATSIATLAGDVPVTVTLPADSGISRVNVISVPPPSDLPPGQTVVASTDISATDASGAAVSRLRAPVRLDLTVPFAGDADDLAIVTRFPSGSDRAGKQEVLDTSVTALSADYRLTATTTHFSPFTVVEIPPLAAGVIPQGFVRTQNALGPHIGTYSRAGSVVLADGRVLVASRQDSYYEQRNADGTFRQFVHPTLAEIFDPLSATWTRTGDPVVDVNALFVLPGGEVYGLFNGNNPQAWSPATGSWRRVSETPTYYSKVVQLRDGRLVSVGGSSGSGDSQQVSILDPATMTWSAVTPMQVQRNDARYYPLFAAALADGRLLVAGGNVPEVEIFDPATGNWSLAAQQFINDEPSVVLPDGRLVVTSSPNSVQIYDPQANTWTAIDSEDSSPTPYGATLTLGPNGQILLAEGGFGGAPAPGRSTPRQVPGPSAATCW